MKTLILAVLFACLPLSVSAITLNPATGTGNISQAEIQGLWGWSNVVYSKESVHMTFCHFAVDSWKVTRTVPGRPPYVFTVCVQRQTHLLVRQTAAGFDFVGTPAAITGTAGVGVVGLPPAMGLPGETVVFNGTKEYFSTMSPLYGNVVKPFP